MVDTRHALMGAVVSSIAACIIDRIVLCGRILDAASPIHTLTHRMARLVKNHRKPGWSSSISGIVDGEGMWHMPLQLLGDDGGKYHGQWHHGVFQGSGVYDWPDKMQYRGDCMDGKRSGMGVHDWPSGVRYEGEWKDDKQNGMGVRLYADGDTFHGAFRDGNRVYGVYTWVNGHKALIKCDDDDEEIESERITGMDV